MVHDPLRTGGAPAGQANTSETDGERIAKTLARAGVASRRAVEKLIEEGRVAVNGVTLTSPGVKVAPGDIVTVDGEVVAEAEPTRLFRYHKAVGLMTSHNDPMGRPTVFGALPPGLPRLISVGRLDVNSEGLLLLTNDGELARALEIPASGIVRRYRARAHGRTTQEKLDTLKAGVTVEGVKYGPIEATLDKAKEGPQGANLWITVTLTEGKNREVRRVLESLGLKVNRLIRLSYGPLALGTLISGELEEVGPRVLREQFADLILPENMPTGDRPQWKAPKVSPQRRAQAEAKARGSERSARPDPAAATDQPEKKVYKAGWAKAKIKARPHPKPAPKPTRDKPGGERPAGAKPGARPVGAKPGAAKRTGPKPFGGQPGSRPLSAKPAGAKPVGAKPAGAKAAGAKAAGAKATGGRPAAHGSARKPTGQKTRR